MGLGVRGGRREREPGGAGRRLDYGAERVLQSFQSHLHPSHPAQPVLRVHRLIAPPTSTCTSTCTSSCTSSSHLHLLSPPPPLTRQAGAKLPARVIGYRLMDGMATVTVRPSQVGGGQAGAECGGKG